MNVAKIFALVFLAIVASLTVTYFVINNQSMSPEYRQILGMFSLLHILLLGGLIFNFPTSNKWWVVLFIMFIGGICKATYARAVPGKQVDDFIFTLWKFNDQWLYAVKVLWHVSLDWLVLFIIVGIKNGNKLFQKK